MSKKLLFAAYSLDIGGIEKALVTLVNYLAEKDYEITIVLEKKQGIFLDKINKKVRIEEYAPSFSKNKLISKAKNIIKRIKFCIKNKNKFDCAIAYATYSLPSSFIARAASKNSILWVHGDYLQVYNNDVSKFKEFLKKLRVNSFKKIVFVSDSSKEKFASVMKANVDTNKLVKINNLIDYKQIVTLSEEKVTDLVKDDVYTFLFVGRFVEEDKKISRIIESAAKLKRKGLNFRVVCIGDGVDLQSYKDQVQNLNLNPNIIFLGKKENPYPYFKIANSMILTSDYEGYPVVFIESMILNLPILTTDVSDAQKEIQNNYGMVVDRDTEAISIAMEQFIKEGYKITAKFNCEKFNEEIRKKLNNLIEGEK